MHGKSAADHRINHQIEIIHGIVVCTAVSDIFLLLHVLPLGISYDTTPEWHCFAFVEKTKTVDC
jgi:hypothetical protein